VGEDAAGLRRYAPQRQAVLQVVAPRLSHFRQNATATRSDTSRVNHSCRDPA
jgi:hypothetical protein